MDRRTSRLVAIVLNYRSADDTALAVLALLRSQRRPDDIIVVDNDATGGCAQALRAVRADVRYIPTASNLGFAGGMNVGIRQALADGADLVLLVNADAIVLPGCIEILERALEARAPDGDGRVGIVGPMILARQAPDVIASLGLRFDPETGRLRHHAAGTGVRDLAAGEPRCVDAVSGCVMLVRRDVIDAVGLLDEPSFFTCEDIDLCLRARAAGYASVVVPAARVHHEGHRSIGASSPRLLAYVTRNHLRLAARVAPRGRVHTTLRALWIVTLSLAFATRTARPSRARAVGAVMRGAHDHLRGRYGEYR